MSRDIVILDCYTDEPSGYGVRPYLGSHQIHLSQALAAQGLPHRLLTIDDLRYAHSMPRQLRGGDTDIATFNRTQNCNQALDILKRASTVYVIFGCFVDYEYFSCQPPRASELAYFLSMTDAEKIGFYVMGTLGIGGDISRTALADTFHYMEHGNAYRFVFERASSGGTANLIDPDYELLSRICREPPPIIEQLHRPVIAEIETGTGCNVPTCSFCIESVRSPRVRYRAPDDVVAQVKCLYNEGIRHFRLGRQPNFFHYQKRDITSLERLLGGIRDSCPNLRMLHIDNVNIIDVVAPTGPSFAKLVSKYCTSGNVAAFGVESFDPNVRKQTRVAGTPEEVQRAVEIINEYGAERDGDGLPRLLPGINLIQGLPGCSEATHEHNLNGLRKIYDTGLMTYRLYYRTLTAPTGVTLRDDLTIRHDNFDACFDEINREFVLPMQTRVYPEGALIRGDWEMVTRSHISTGRTLGTCSIKVELAGPPREVSGVEAQVRIDSSLGYRLLKGKVEKEGYHVGVFDRARGGRENDGSTCNERV